MSNNEFNSGQDLSTNTLTKLLNDYEKQLVETTARVKDLKKAIKSIESALHHINQNHFRK